MVMHVCVTKYYINKATSISHRQSKQ